MQGPAQRLINMAVHVSKALLTEFVQGLSKVPRLIVLDIDYTIWPFHVDTHVSPPFKSDGNGGACDRYGTKINLFRDVRTIFNELREIGISLAAASRTEDPDASRELLGVLNIDGEFAYKEIFPSRKFTHFENLKRTSGVDYNDMLFFDDEFRNIRDISTIGVTCIHVNDDIGLDFATLKRGLQEFNRTT